ncbi:MAG: hypothetical protein A4E48_01139 [Methanosaeta sp. PtaU1.Bin060]|nr:MAG: hypothetical protein A4E48_01139 [Methanosaeta sp. PtaU1.Bin060]
MLPDLFLSASPFAIASSTIRLLSYHVLNTFRIIVISNNTKKLICIQKEIDAQIEGCATISGLVLMQMLALMSMKMLMNSLSVKMHVFVNEVDAE